MEVDMLHTGEINQSVNRRWHGTHRAGGRKADREPPGEEPQNRR